MFQIFSRDRKVEYWLQQQQCQSVTNICGAHAQKTGQSLSLVQTWECGPADGHSLSNKIAVGGNDAISIVSLHKSPPLCVIYPNLNKQEFGLTENKLYSSAVFIQKGNKQFLAAACVGENSIHLWDVEHSTYRAVYFKRTFEPRSMNIFVIDDNTVGYGEAKPTGNSCKVFILNTDDEKWNLSNTLSFNTTFGYIRDMCYAKTPDGTPCILLCCPHDSCVQAVEMVGGRTRWQCDKQQMGQMFKPWSICPDEESAVFVVDVDRFQFHTLSSEDGSALLSVSLIQCGIMFPFCVRYDDGYVYVGYVHKGNMHIGKCVVAVSSRL